MPNLNNWLGSVDLGGLDQQYDIAGIMARVGVSIVLVRDGVGALAAQTVIAAPPRGFAIEVTGETGQSGRNDLLLVGYRAYAGKTDFDVKHGDRFVYNGTQYRVKFVDNRITGRREAYAEASQ